MPKSDVWEKLKYGFKEIITTMLKYRYSFATGPGDRGSIPGLVIPKTQKCFLMPPCLTIKIIRYGSKVKWRYPGTGVALFRTPRCSSY